MTKFNAEQLEFINSGICDLKLIGIPGGGKTRCIIEHIRKNISVGNFASPDDYMIITFSRRAREDFLTKGKKAYNNHLAFFGTSRAYAFSQKNVRTIHSLSMYILKGQENGNCSIKTVVARCRNYLADNTKQYDPSLNSIKMLYVDEAQDISKTQYQFILNFITRIGCKVAFVGDPNQNIYQFQEGSDKYMRNHPGCKSIMLRINYRSTQTLIDFFNDMMPTDIRGNINDKMISAEYNPDNNNTVTEQQKPIIVAGNYRAIAQHIAENVKKYHGGRENIAIISPVKLSRPQSHGSYSNMGLSFAIESLERARIKYICHYDDADSDHAGTKTDITCKKDHVNLMTMHGSKGLEFDFVILLNFHQNYMGAKPTEDDYNNSTYLWYVGITRAKSRLIMYKNNRDDVYFGLSKVRKDTYDILPLCDKSNFELPKEKNISRENIWEKLRVSINESMRNMSEDNMMILEDSADVTYITSQMYDKCSLQRLRDYKHLSRLYQSFITNMLQYMYITKTGGQLSDLSACIETENINSIVFLRSDYKKCFRALLKLFDCSNYLCISAADIDKIKDNKELMLSLPSGSADVLMEMRKKYDNCDKLVIGFAVKNLLQFVNRESTDAIINKLRENAEDFQIVKECIFKLCLYVYQYNYERASLWNKNFSQHISDCSTIIHNLQCFIARKMHSNDYEFAVCKMHGKIPLQGLVDIVKPRASKYIKLHFAEEESAKTEMLNLLLNSYCHSANSRIEIWNIPMGKKYKISHKSIGFGPIATFAKMVGKKFNNISLIIALDIDFSSGEPAICGYSATSRDLDFFITFEQSRESLRPVESLRVFFRKILDFCDTYSLIIHNENDIIAQLFAKNAIDLPKHTSCISKILSEKYHRDFTDYDIADMYREIHNIGIKNEHSSQQSAKLMKELLR